MVLLAMAIRSKTTGMSVLETAHWEPARQWEIGEELVEELVVNRFASLKNKTHTLSSSAPDWNRVQVAQFWRGAFLANNCCDICQWQLQTFAILPEACLVCTLAVSCTMCVHVVRGTIALSVKQDTAHLPQVRMANMLCFFVRLVVCTSSVGRGCHGERLLSTVLRFAQAQLACRVWKVDVIVTALVQRALFFSKRNNKRV